MRTSFAWGRGEAGFAASRAVVVIVGENRKAVAGKGVAVGQEAGRA